MPAGIGPRGVGSSKQLLLGERFGCSARWRVCSLVALIGGCLVTTCSTGSAGGSLVTVTVGALRRCTWGIAGAKAKEGLQNQQTDSKTGLDWMTRTFSPEIASSLQTFRRIQTRDPVCRILLKQIKRAERPLPVRETPELGAKWDLGVSTPAFPHLKPIITAWLEVKEAGGDTLLAGGSRGTQRQEYLQGATLGRGERRSNNSL